MVLVPQIFEETFLFFVPTLFRYGIRDANIFVADLLKTEAYTGFETGNNFFSDDYQRCRSGIKSTGKSLPRKWCYS